MKERIDGLCKMCTIESSAKNRLGFAVVIPGLFHLKLAATNAFWRTHVQPQEGHNDPNGFFEYICHLHPKETGKFLSSPGFWRLHDSIHHTAWIFFFFHFIVRQVEPMMDFTCFTLKAGGKGDAAQGR